MFPGSPATQPRRDSRGCLSRSVSWIAVSSFTFDTNFIGVRHARVEPSVVHFVASNPSSHSFRLAVRILNRGASAIRDGLSAGVRLCAI